MGSKIGFTQNNIIIINILNKEWVGHLPCTLANPNSIPRTLYAYQTRSVVILNRIWNKHRTQLNMGKEK